jgi:GxxExxY protein
MTGTNHITADYALSELTDKIIRCAQAVHKQIGSGFHEMVYKRPLAFELFIREIPFEREMDILLNNNDRQPGKMSADFLVDGKIMVELKSTMQRDGISSSLEKEKLEAHEMELGLILNFGAEKLEYRIVKCNKSQGFTLSEALTTLKIW